VRHDGEDDYGLPRIDIVVPDDARELDRDLAAWRREEKRRLRRERGRRLLGPLTRFGVAGPLIAGVLLVALLSGILMSVFGPRATPRPSTLRTAVPTIPNFKGTVFLDTPLFADGKRQSPESLRPGVIMIVPYACKCDALVEQFSDQADRRVAFFVIADKRDPKLPQPQALKEMRRMTGTFKNKAAVILDDPTDELADHYGAEGLTAIMVDGGGKVYDIRSNLNANPIAPAPTLDMSRL
jgi:hypothetical protein